MLMTPKQIKRFQWIKQILSGGSVIPNLAEHVKLTKEFEHLREQFEDDLLLEGEAPCQELTSTR